MNISQRAIDILASVFSAPYDEMIRTGHFDAPREIPTDQALRAIELAFSSPPTVGEALPRYGDHTGECRLNRLSENCICGWSDVLASLNKEGGHHD